MKKILFGLFLASVFSGCLKADDTNNTNCTYNECGVVAPASEIQAVKDYLSANNITATQHCSGLFYKVDDPGTGATPTACSTVAFSYEGKLTNGSTFDKSTQPVAFNLSQLIRGFQIGMMQVKAGGHLHLYVPPTLGYGANSSGSIPPNSVLIFDVTVVGVQ